MVSPSLMVPMCVWVFTCVKDDLRPRVIESATVAALLARLTDRHLDVVKSGIRAVLELAKHGESGFMFGVCWSLISEH